MRKEATAALFVVLLLFSTFVATVSSTPPGGENDLPEDVVPYLVGVDAVYMEDFWAKPGYYKGLYVVNLTAGYIEMINVSISVFGQGAAFMSGTDMVLYATEIRIQITPEWIVPLTPEMIDGPNGPAVQQQLHDLIQAIIDEFGYLPYQELDMISQVMSNMYSLGMSLVAPADAITSTSDSVFMRQWSIDEYSGLTKTTAQKLTARNQLMFVDAGEYCYEMGPMSEMVMENVELYTTYVKERGFGLIPLEWYGDDIPGLVKFLSWLLPWFNFMTRVTMKYVAMSAYSVTVPLYEVDITA